MSQVAIAKRYAKALLDIGKEKGIIAELAQQLQSLHDIYANSRDFRNTVLNPSIEVEERKALIKAIAKKYGWHQIMLNFTLLLLDRHRLQILPELMTDFQQQVDVLQSRLRAEVTSATALTLPQQEQLRQSLSKLTGLKQVELDLKVDETLLGGVVTRMGGVVVDGSIRTQLEKIRSSILQEI